MPAGRLPARPYAGAAVFPRALFRVGPSSGGPGWAGNAMTVMDVYGVVENETTPGSLLCLPSLFLT
jgi:hypothetical protein